MGGNGATKKQVPLEEHKGPLAFEAIVNVRIVIAPYRTWTNLKKLLLKSDFSFTIVAAQFFKFVLKIFC